MIRALTTALLAGSALLVAVSASAQDACQTDFDGDGATTAADVEVFKSYMGATEDDAEFEAAADLDGDGEVGLSDYNILLSCME